jgi:hypothetical protein
MGETPTLVLTHVNQEEAQGYGYRLATMPVLNALFHIDVNTKTAQVEQDKIPIGTYHMHRERGSSTAGSDGCQWGSCPGCAG